MKKYEFICSDSSANKNKVVKYVIYGGTTKMIPLDKFYFTLFPPEADRANEIYVKIASLVSTYTLANRLYTKDHIEDIITMHNNETFAWSVEYVESELLDSEEIVKGEI